MLQSIFYRVSHLLLFTSDLLCKIKNVPSYCHHIFNFICDIVFTNKLSNIFTSHKYWCDFCQCWYHLQSEFWELEGRQCVLLIIAKTHSIYKFTRPVDIISPHLYQHLPTQTCHQQDPKMLWKRFQVSAVKSFYHSYQGQR